MAAEIMQWNVRETREPAEVGSLVLDGWELKKLLGKGGSGSVWLAEKNLLNIKAQSAVKIISIPHEAGTLDVMRSEGMSREQVQAELLEQVQVTVREIQAMLVLRNHPAVVLCENYDIVQYEDDGTWDVFIRMELLESLTNWAAGRNVQEEEVRKLGLTLASLLAECEEKKILHRDIKPTNIFIDQNNNFKLGDFGLARILSAGVDSVHSKGVGTEAFMAPEVFYGEKYDHRADIYSLGLVLYWLLNHQTIPFMNEDISRSRAVTKRLGGEKLPELAEVHPELAKIVQKACADKPEERYQTAKDLYEALQEYPEQSKAKISQNPVETAPNIQQRKEPAAVANQAQGKSVNLEANKPPVQGNSKIHEEGIPAPRAQINSSPIKPKKKILPFAAILLTAGLLIRVLFVTGVFPLKDAVNISAGSIISFGHYEQDNNLENGPEEIEWIVLDYDETNNKALLLSKYGLETKRYNTKSTWIAWENCTLREWLNGTSFLNNAFTTAEQNGILLTNVDNGSSQGYSKWSTSGGNNTQDKIFLLSYAEANKYLGVTYEDNKNTKSRVAPTAYAIKQGAYTSGSRKTADGTAAGWWWLRSPGNSYLSIAARIGSGGSLGNSSVGIDGGCVRPALWLNVESDIFKSENQ